MKFHRQTLKLFGSILLCASIALPLQGCSAAKKVALNQKAKSLAGPAQLLRRSIDAGNFTLTAFERVYNRGRVAHLYIEGDDPKAMRITTPKMLTALHLASRDKTKNVIYLSRPCQFKPNRETWQASLKNEERDCDLKYLTTHRYSQEVISSYNEALDDLRKRWKIKGFHVYGHAGGGAIAALLATKRKDIVSLTTVSSILDIAAYSDTMRQSNPHWDKSDEMFSSYNPADIAHMLGNLPQYHYIGGMDEAIPPAALLSFISRIGPTNCVQYKMIQENGFNKGWVGKWSSILKDRPICEGPVLPTALSKTQMF